jgi:multidrug efflux system membrane fusion protein
MDTIKGTRRWWKYWWVLLLIVLVAIAAYSYRSKASAAARTPPSAGTAKKGTKGKGGGDGAASTPVIAVKARKGNIGVYFTGLGAVTPIYTVTLKSRVDGELMTVLYREGDMVRKGEPLMEIDPRPYQAQLDQMEGQLMKDQATLDNARIDQTRYETLLKQNAIPEQQLATQKATVLQDEGTVKADEGQVENARLNLVYCHITAPITGRIGLRLVDPGNIVHASDANGLLVITQIDPISVLFTVAEDQLPQVLQKLRAKQTLQVDAYDREMKTKLASGTLTTVDNQIDQTTGTVRIRATFDNKNSSLFPNQFVNARLLVQEKKNVVLLSSAAIQRTSSTTFVYLVKPDGTVTVRNITVGTVEGEDSEITSGLVEGDVVVQTGADKLQEGSHVNAQIPGEPSANTPPSSGTKPAKGKKK